MKLCVVDAASVITKGDEFVDTSVEVFALNGLVHDFSTVVADVVHVTEFCFPHGRILLPTCRMTEIEDSSTIAIEELIGWEIQNWFVAEIAFCALEKSI